MVVVNVVMMVRYRFSIHALILNRVTVCTTVLGSLLVLLIYLLFSFHRRLSVMPYHSLSLVSIILFIYAKDALSAPLSRLFTAMLRHGIVPDTLRDCIIVSITKPGKDPSDSYRPITLAPILSKVFEWCLVFQFQSCFITSSL